MKKTLLGLSALSALSFAGLSPIVPAYSDERVPIVTDKLVKDECGACHMAFQPRFLPAASWKKLMAGLPDHFGEDASLDEQATRHITNYLVKNAGKRRRKTKAKAKANVIANANDIPISISKLRWFEHEHRDKEVSPQARKKAGTMANCPACHKAADKGYYDDD